MEEPGANPSSPPEDMETDQQADVKSKMKNKDASQDTTSAETKPVEEVDKISDTNDSSQDTICMEATESETADPVTETDKDNPAAGNTVEAKESEPVTETHDSTDTLVEINIEKDSTTDIINSAAAAADIVDSAAPVVVKPVRTGDLKAVADAVNAKETEDQPWTNLVAQLVNSVGGTSSGEGEIVVIVENDQKVTDEDGIPKLVLENGTDENSHDVSENQDQAEQREFRCWYCEEVFDSNAEREEHEKMHTESKFVLLICQECGQSFQKSEDFESHHQTCSGDGENGDECRGINDRDEDANSSFSGENSNSQTESVSPMKSSGGNLECVFCDTVYDSKANLRKHMVLKHQMVKDNTNAKLYCCKFCTVTFPDREVMITHEDGHKNKKYSCTYCGNCFTTRGSLLEHERKHTGEKPFSCPHCSKCCSRERDLKDHIKRLHLGNVAGNKLTCNYCFVVFVTRKQLLDHLEDSHNVKRIKESDPSESNFICRECGKEFHFKAKRQFDEHIATHSRDNLHVCQECGKTFVRARELGYHMARHRGEGRYMCSICQKNFVLKWDLKKHLKTQHDVDEDGTFIKDTRPRKKPKLMNIMDQDITVMDDIFKVNPYICRVCHAQFEGGKELRAHRKTHEEEDASTSSQMASFPFICSFCSKGFQNKSDFVEHVGEHTKGTQGQKKSLPLIAPKPPNMSPVTLKVVPTVTVVSPMQVISSPSLTPNSTPGASPSLRRPKRLDKGEGVEFWRCCFTTCLRLRSEYNTTLAFEEHIKTHMEGNNSICEYCGRCFTRARDLTYHKKENGVRPCKYMMMSFAENKNGKPKRLLPQPSDQSTHTCGCGKVLQGFKEFQLHVLSHKSSDDCKYCQYCGRNFDNQKALTEHLKEDSEDACKYASPGVDVNGDCEDGSGSQEDAKHSQSTSVVSSGANSMNMVLVQPVTLPLVNTITVVPNNNIVGQNSPRASKEVEKPYACGYCGKAFRGRSYLREHETMHTKKFDFECMQCDRKFTRARELRYHEDKHGAYNGQEPYPCKQCDKRFITKANFRAHMENFHDSPNTVYDDDSVTANNESIHISSSAFKCTFCCKHFNVLDHFKAHMEIVHDVEVSVVNEDDVNENDEIVDHNDEIADHNDEIKDQDDEIEDSEPEKRKIKIEPEDN